ncbi:hypothetical protein [Catellatospora sichuanensis]|uniref:hypothetical protein n=1 Tax=Catellatospora sichuanensis TaxID=1969805 RepID=UPI0011831C8A|nr:hypothetical protein [Catellatospora sichuanensis]
MAEPTERSEASPPRESPSNLRIKIVASSVVAVIGVIAGVAQISGYSIKDLWPTGPQQPSPSPTRVGSPGASATQSTQTPPHESTAPASPTASALENTTWCAVVEAPPTASAGFNIKVTINCVLKPEERLWLLTRFVNPPYYKGTTHYAGDPRKHQTVRREPGTQVIPVNVGKIEGLRCFGVTIVTIDLTPDQEYRMNPPGRMVSKFDDACTTYSTG